MPVDNEQVIRQAYKIAEDRISRGRRGRRQGGPPVGRHPAQVKTAIYDQALSVGFGRGLQVSAGAC
jgi:hypothetical protein